MVAVLRQDLLATSHCHCVRAQLEGPTADEMGSTRTHVAGDLRQSPVGSGACMSVHSPRSHSWREGEQGKDDNSQSRGTLAACFS